MKKKYFLLIAVLFVVIDVVMAFNLKSKTSVKSKSEIFNSNALTDKFKVKNIKPSQQRDTIKLTNFEVDSEGVLKKIFINDNTIEVEEYDISSGKFKFNDEELLLLKKNIKNLDNYKLVKTVLLDQNILDNKFPIDKLVFAFSYNIIDDKSDGYIYPSIKAFSIIYILKLDGSLLNSFIIKEKIVNSVSLNQNSDLVLVQILTSNLDTTDKELFSSIIIYKLDNNNFKEELKLIKKYHTVFFYRNSIFTITKLNNPFSEYKILNSNFEIIKSMKINTFEEGLWFDSSGVYKTNKSNIKKYISTNE